MQDSLVILVMLLNDFVSSQAVNHAILGIIVIFIGLLQPCNACLRPSFHDGYKTKKRIYWSILHKSSGIICLILSQAAIQTGLRAICADALSIMHFIYISIVTCIFLAFEVCFVVLFGSFFLNYFLFHF